MLQRWIILFLFLSSLFMGAAPALAAEPTARIHGILINADSMFRDNEKETAELEGNVQIVFQGQHIRADRARVFLRVRQVQLFGNVEIMDAKNTISGDRVFLDYDNNTGIIYDGYVQAGSVLFSGSELRKTGETNYLVSTADYTTCTNCPASWSFSGTTVRAELGGYAYIKNAILRVGSYPIFWFPYLVVPLKSDRQSGVLPPVFELTGSGGLALSVPYFWAISESSDATIELKNYSKRGLKALGEYRYVLNENSEGSINAASLRDNGISTDGRLNRFRPLGEQNQPLDRWFIRSSHYQEMPDGGIFRAQVNLASDLQYPKDFPLETLNHGDSAMENRMSYTKNTNSQHYSVDSSYYMNLLHADPLSGNEDAVHRMPELRFSQAQKNIGKTNFIYSVDMNVANFARSGNAWDDLTTDASGLRFPRTENCAGGPNWENDPACRRVYDGTFDPASDMIRTGQRLDFQPTLYYPVRLGNSLDLLPKLAYRETHYNFNIPSDPSAARRYLRTELTARTNLNRIYGDTLNPKATRYKHEIIPEVTYTRLPWYSQSNHPFFGRGSQTDAPYFSRDRLTDFDIASDYGAQFDYNDRVYDRNLVTFAMINKLTQKRWLNDRPSYRQIAYLKLAQSYDESQKGTGGNAEPWSNLTAILDVRLDNFETYSQMNYFPYQNVTNSSSKVRYIADGGQFAETQLSIQYPVTPGQTVDISARQEDYTLAGGVITKFINAMGKVTYDANPVDSAGYKLKSWALITQLKPPGDCIVINLAATKFTGSDETYSIMFDFNFDGVPKPPLPSTALDQGF